MATSESRRSFMGFAFGAVAAVGGVFSLVAMKKTWDPLPSVKAAGFTTVDLSGMQNGELRTIEWRKKPIFILKKDSNMGKDSKRDVVVQNDTYTVVIGLCTHLGCIPAYAPNEQLFKCACHGGEFDTSGKNIFGPPPRPLDIPPFKIDGTKLVLGEEGSEYKKMIAEV
ncbi:ubiquinol-cytochrome c reductase iron-sulfur subunit [Campylobacter sp. MIT 21-1685]|uniref:ubiquinol-cytochrome c reductase iron-sulfur subunit n=1 Tax=unclassified Campylobacter TaxID=2593542 RepID=UPI00224B62DE|nr:MULTISPECIES: ubiquinol-cytochrome c reductase iron-sulfur subunit [unclassified Campylobacter]MCX2682852.1 ubiquinol-cytochrome c reductase iron-sulfur subunit [Campylobacter sp. MIT 21-1684]MCX2751200.1 ubiquinol-cytochrome c reductase iron-sulfur subunit [Campylobacter sp. MIT 21-1682]MCX2807333.1 ubiquinol-cytochrome c reductase iron-sulfur subunit [Campylobacter sp. MIT 21-1685]